MSLGSSSTRLTPAMAASNGSAPCDISSCALATAWRPFLLETATAPGLPACARTGRALATAAAAAAVPRSFLREMDMTRILTDFERAWNIAAAVRSDADKERPMHVAVLLFSLLAAPAQPAASAAPELTIVT